MNVREGNLPGSMSESSFSLLEYKLSSVCSMPWNMVLLMLGIFATLIKSRLSRNFSTPVLGVNTRSFFLVFFLSFCFFKFYDKIYFMRILCSFSIIWWTFSWQFFCWTLWCDFPLDALNFTEKNVHNNFNWLLHFTLENTHSLSLTLALPLYN